MRFASGPQSSLWSDYGLTTYIFRVCKRGRVTRTPCYVHNSRARQGQLSVLRVLLFVADKLCVVQLVRRSSERPSIMLWLIVIAYACFPSCVGGFTDIVVFGDSLSDDCTHGASNVVDEVLETDQVLTALTLTVLYGHLCMHMLHGHILG